MNFIQEDKSLMRLALGIAKCNLGSTAPNPSVGAVICKNGVILSTGVTGKDGVPHAERDAIDKVKNKKILEDSTLYVTLEPCSHHGKTLPCTNLIAKYKIKKVVVALSDYADKRVDGKGIDMMKKLGIEVSVGLFKKEAGEINIGFFYRKLLNRPFITIKVATSLDGRIATKKYDSKWITNEFSRKYSHCLRKENDAILVGSNTILKDNPMLDCRIVGLEKFSPKRIFLCNNNIDISTSNILKTSTKIKTYLATSNVKLIDNSLDVILCNKEKNSNEICINDLVSKISEIGINSLLVEGGKHVISSFMKYNLVDKLVVMLGNFMIGGDGIGYVGNLNFDFIHEINNFFFLKEIKKFKNDTILIYEKIK